MKNQVQKYEPNGEFLTTIERLATNPEVDVSKIEAFLNMQERILDRKAKDEFNAAMVRVQGKIDLVVAKEKNEQTRSMYANLKSILLQVKPIYTEEGFSLMFYEGETEKENHKRIYADIMHRDGHTEKRYVDVAIQTTGIAGKAMMTQIHGEGSAISYGRRYLTCMIFNIPTGDDDDGNSASRSPIETISQDQIIEIQDLIKETEMNEKGFLNTLKVNKLSDLDDVGYKRALGILNARKNQR